MAARVKALVTPALVRWARETAGFTLPEAAARLKLTEDEVAGWESPDPDLVPSIPQLRRVAGLYKRPLAVFYLAEAPPRFEVMRDLRRLPGAGSRRFSPELQFEMRAANERRELALELLSELGETPAEFALLAEQRENPEAVGTRIRLAYGITEELQLAWRDADGRAGFNAWRARIEATGVLVFQATRIGSDEASGFAKWADRLPIIVVNRKDAPTRRLFSLVHELTHLMLRVSGVSEIETDVARPAEDQAIEVFCNHVAAAALVPQNTLLAEPRVIALGAGSEDWTDADVAELARRFNVSREALLRRLLTFGRTTERFYQRKRAQYLAEYLANRQRMRELAGDEGIPRNMPQEAVSNFGRPLVRILLGNYYQDRISLSELSGYLGLKVQHLPKLEQAAGMR
jgi:Zn-dependent peptidase ImmA (M78 family)